MGFRRIRNITIISLLIIGEVVLGEEIIKVELISKSSYVMELVKEAVKILAGAVPSIGLAFYAARKERKKREEFEKESLKEKERLLNSEWYNSLILEKVLEGIRDYYVYIDRQLNEIELLEDENEKKERILNFTSITRAEREKIRSYISYIKLFNKELYGKCQGEILNSVDINSSEESDIEQKKRRNRKARDEIFKLLYEYTFELGKN